MSDLGPRVEAVIVAIAKRQAVYMASWADLFVALGRAQQAATDVECEHWLHRAEDLEYELTGDCGATGALLDELDQERRVAAGLPED